MCACENGNTFTCHRRKPKAICDRKTDHRRLVDFLRIYNQMLSPYYNKNFTKAHSRKIFFSFVL